MRILIACHNLFCGSIRFLGYAARPKPLTLLCKACSLPLRGRSFLRAGSLDVAIEFRFSGSFARCATTPKVRQKVDLRARVSARMHIQRIFDSPGQGLRVRLHGFPALATNATYV